MRTRTNNGVTVIAPDEIVFLKDNNIVTITDNNGYSVTASVTIGSTTLTYLGTTSSLTFNVTNALVLNPSATVIRVVVTSNGTSTTFTFSLTNILDGKTLPTRSHASEDVILIPQGITSVDLFTPYACTIVSSGGATDTLVAGFNTKSVGTWGNILYQYAEGVSFNYGDFDDEKTINSSNLYRSVQVKQCCIPQHGVSVIYTNTDGCTRYLVGVVNREASSRETFEFMRSNTIVRERPSSIVIGNEQRIVVHIAGVPRGAMAKDIMYCDNVVLTNANGTVLAATLVTTNFLDVADQNYQDIELEFCVMK